MVVRVLKDAKARDYYIPGASRSACKRRSSGMSLEIGEKDFWEEGGRMKVQGLRLCGSGTYSTTEH